MVNYQRLYHLMVNASENALAALEAGNPLLAQKILIDAEREAEEQVLSAETGDEKYGNGAAGEIIRAAPLYIAINNPY